MMDILNRSWNSFSNSLAERYLKTFGHPSEGSKELLVDVLKSHFGHHKISILDLGCGNGQLYGFFKERELFCNYTGVDFSDALLQVAKEVYRDDPNAQFIKDDVHTLHEIQDKFDIVLYSHVIEMLSSPELSLASARRLAKKVIIRFFEPPREEALVVELREQIVDDINGKTVPYIRWKMSKDYYRLILSQLACKKVEIYFDETSKDQIHLLHFD